MAFQRESWSTEEWQRAAELLKIHEWRVVAVMIKRPAGSLKEKIRWENMTDEHRQQRRDQLKARRLTLKETAPSRRRRKPTTPIIQVDPRPRVCKQALAERAARRDLEHRDLTGAFFGDPLPGYSALDQREQRA